MTNEKIQSLWQSIIFTCVALIFFVMVFDSSTWFMEKMATYIDARQYGVWYEGIYPMEIISINDVHGFIKYCAAHGSKTELQINPPSCFINGNIVPIAYWQIYVK